MADNIINVAITGAAGQIGYALVFRIASGAMFGPNVKVALRLIELEAALPALKGVVMELDDCAFPLLASVTCTSDINVGMQGVNWALLVGAVPRRAGMERADLLNINGGIFTVQGRAINDNAAKDVRVLVVGNPCNTNCFITMSHAPDVPNDRFFAMTMLDENRAKAQLAGRARCQVSDVTNMIIWGNHSATQYPDFYNAKINGQPAPGVINDDVWLKEEFIRCVQQRGAAVIKARGASSAASAANAIVNTVYQLTHDTPDGDTFSVCLASKGEYGIDQDLIFSYPCRVEQGVVKVVLGVKHNEHGQAMLQATLEELRQERETITENSLV